MIETDGNGYAVTLLGTELPVGKAARAVTTPAAFDPLFTQTLAARIAAEISICIREKGEEGSRESLSRARRT